MRSILTALQEGRLFELPGAVFNEGSILGFYATHDVNPALERTVASANLKYVLTLNDDTHTVDVVLRLERRY